MLIYILHAPTSIATKCANTEFKLIFLPEIAEHNLPYIHTTTITQYGIPLTPLEIEYYNNHYSIWLDFLQRDQEICLIMENYQDFIDNIDTLKINTHEVENNELIIPYHPFQKQNQASDITYYYGTRMDTFAYYINQTTAKTLSSYKMIEYPIDEFFIYLSERNDLSINIIDKKISTPLYDDRFCKDRNENKLKTILSTSHWTAKKKTEALEALCYIFEIAILLEIPMFLSDGSLLGLIRHHDIMAWDDDIDITIDYTYLDKLFSQIEQDNIYKITKHVWKEDTIYYKMWAPNGTEISGYTHRFPFIDIWTYNEVNEAIEFSYRSPIISKIIFPLQVVKFNHFEVKIPNTPLAYLDELFSNWRTCIQIYSWNHQTETNSNNLLYATVATDLEGKIVLNDSIINSLILE